MSIITTRFVLQRLLPGLLCLALCACATNPKPLGGSPEVQVVEAATLPAPKPAGSDYLVSPYDKLEVGVFGIEQLETREIQVDASGMASFPLVGVFQAGGKSLAQIHEYLAQRLRAAYVRNPEVVVNLKEMVSQQVTVDGQVVRPGIYPVVGPMTLMKAVAKAEGVAKYAKLDDVVVFRTVEGQRFAALYNLQAIRRGAYPDPTLFANDVVVVGDSKSRRIFDDIVAGLPLLTTPLILLLRG